MKTDATVSRSLNDQALALRTRQLYAQQRRRNCAKADRLFMWLMILQWIAAVVIALVVTPRTWIADTPHLHLHVKLAIGLGGLISLPAILLTWRLPGQPKTRLTVAIAQGAWTCLLIHLCGGRLETHFHAFGSLAFLAFYREWRLLIVTSLIVTLDHVVRGSLWPISVYGVAIDSTYRFLEHAGWLTWINVFLVKSCVQHLAEERRGCERQALLEVTNAAIEERIEERTRDLATANEQLEAEFVEHRKTQEQRERAFRDLAVASRRAGMTEVATGVLHNVGNVLNSVNVSANLLQAADRNSRLSRLAQATDIITKNEANLAEFLTRDERGRHFPAVMRELTDLLLDEQQDRQEELTTLATNLEHIHEVIRFQQSFAKEKSIVEETSLCELVEDALKINTVHKYLDRFRVERDFSDVPNVLVDKHKVLQVLINLISNARHALIDSGRDDALMRIVVEDSSEMVRVHVIDNGVGIAPENVDSIFAHGFTTKESGHGFGLHSSALAAQGLGGSLSVQSDGVGRGAMFTLAFPSLKESPCKV